MQNMLRRVSCLLVLAFSLPAFATLNQTCSGKLEDVPWPDLRPMPKDAKYKFGEVVRVKGALEDKRYVVVDNKWVLSSNDEQPSYYAYQLRELGKNNLLTNNWIWVNESPFDQYAVELKREAQIRPQAYIEPITLKAKWFAAKTSTEKVKAGDIFMIPEIHGNKLFMAYHSSKEGGGWAHNHLFPDLLFVYAREVLRADTGSLSLGSGTAHFTQAPDSPSTVSEVTLVGRAHLLLEPLPGDAYRFLDPQHMQIHTYYFDARYIDARKTASRERAMVRDEKASAAFQAARRGLPPQSSAQAR